MARLLHIAIFVISALSVFCIAKHHADLIEDDDSKIPISLHRLGKFLNLVHGDQHDLHYLHQQIIRQKEFVYDFDECLNAIETVLLDAIRPNRTGAYARRMLDAWGRPQSGILQGSLRWWGQYYECVQAVGPSTTGKWCEMHVGQYVVNRAGVPIGVSVGGCFPEQCDGELLKNLSKNVEEANLIFPNASIDQRQFRCPTPSTVLTARDFVAIVVISVLFILLTSGTCFELLYVQKQGVYAKENLGLLSKLLLSFSLYSNTKMIINMRPRNDKLSVLDGIRFITMTWVIIGHTYFFLWMNEDNPAAVTAYTRDHILFMAIGNGTYSVDTFFFIGGCLVAYLGIKTVTKNKGRINIFAAYLQRYLRLTPAYAFSILLMVSLYRFMGSGPYFDQVSQQLYEQCKDTWWAQLVYIGNMYPPGNYCFSWGWYMQCDMQFYLVTPFILMIFYRSKAFGYFIVVFFTLANMAIVGSLVGVYNITDNLHISMLSGTILGWKIDYSLEVSAETIFQYDTYYTPYCRMAAYMIGMATGFIVYQTNGKINMSKPIAFIGWFLATGSALAIIYSLYPSLHNGTFIEDPWTVIYQLIARPLWSLCIGWLTIASVAGYAGPIFRFLSWTVFLPLGRLTFAAYLLHPLVISWYGGTLEQPEHFLVGQYVFIYLGVVVLSYGFGYVLSVCVEMPFAMMVKALFSPSSIKGQNAEVEMNNVKSANEAIRNPYVN